MKVNGPLLPPSIQMHVTDADLPQKDLRLINLKLLSKLLLNKAVAFTFWLQTI